MGLTTDTGNRRPPGALHASPYPGPAERRRSWPRRLAWIGASVVLLSGAAVGTAWLVWSPVGLGADQAALAHVDLPPGSTVVGVRAVDPSGHRIPLNLRNGALWPRRRLPTNERVSVNVIVRRPSAVGWLLGSEAHLHLTMRTPGTRVTRRWLTLATGQPVRVRFAAPVRVVAVGAGAHRRARALPRPAQVVTFPRATAAGLLEVAGAPRTWERLPAAAAVSWFPAGRSPAAVVSPAPGGHLLPTSTIRIAFSRPVADLLGSRRPTVEPSTSGVWRQVDAHTLTFRPNGYGFPLGGVLRVRLPRYVTVVRSDSTRREVRSLGWSVAPGSTLRAEQILAQLGYLPVAWSAARHGVLRTPGAQAAAAVAPPAGRFTWRFPNTPASLRQMWSPGQSGTVLQGALMAFQYDRGLTTDGLLGPDVWRSLMGAAVARKRSSFGYSYVLVRRALPQSLTVWHDGKILITAPANTGIASAPTDPGTYPVYERMAVGTMSGTNPDGSHYSDPGIPWISYFHGGDAIHGFNRGSYGVPQSLGCVELQPGAAGQVWPETPIGTLVNVEV
jgi:hypothetical protein